MTLDSVFDLSPHVRFELVEVVARFLSENNVVAHSG
jgi:hypothetical protein